MKYGVSIIPNTDIMPITQLATAVEDRGLDALFMGEHIHIPVKPRIPYPLPTMSAEYLRELDLIVAMSAAAAATRRIKLASGVCLVTAHDPIILAKQFASLDVLSGGRIIIGLGTGWTSEIETHGTAFENRWKVFKERVEAMKAIWTNEQAEYHGEFVNFPPIFCPPKPVQKPYPPLATWGGKSRHPAYRLPGRMVSAPDAAGAVPGAAAEADTPLRGRGPRSTFVPDYRSSELSGEI